MIEFVFVIILSVIRTANFSATMLIILFSYMIILLRIGLRKYFLEEIKADSNYTLIIKRLAQLIVILI